MEHSNDEEKKHVETCLKLAIKHLEMPEKYEKRKVWSDEGKPEYFNVTKGERLSTKNTTSKLKFASYPIRNVT